MLGPDRAQIWVVRDSKPSRDYAAHAPMKMLALALCAVAQSHVLDQVNCVGESCAVSPLGQMCKAQGDCPADQTCVHESQYYAQCVDCNATVFATQCAYYSVQFLVKAMEVCKINKCGTRCPHHVDTDCTAPQRCAVQAGGVWSQCVDCNATLFDEQCKYWSAPIRTAAEAICKETCPNIKA
jgi:hypothetical protein